MESAPERGARCGARCARGGVRARRLRGGVRERERSRRGAARGVRARRREERRRLRDEQTVERSTTAEGRSRGVDDDAERFRGGIFGFVPDSLAGGVETRHRAAARRGGVHRGVLERARTVRRRRVGTTHWSE